jgi:signal transduction histidine kinase
MLQLKILRKVMRAREGLFLPQPTQISLLEHYLNISRLLAGQMDFAAIIRAISGELAQLVPYDHMDICIKSLDGRFHIAYEDGMDSLWSQQPPAPLTTSPIRTLLSGSVDHLITDDASIDPRFHFEGALSSPIIQLALRARIHVPLRVHGDIIGALSCSSRRTAFYQSHHLKNAQAVADLLAPYFFAIRASEQANRSAIEEAAANARAEGLRLGALQLTQELEAERQRIGMDLHDQTLADLTRMSRRLTRLSHLPELSGEALEPLLHSLQICMQDLRQIIDDAKPSILQLFGLVEAIETFVEKSIRDNGSSVVWNIDDQTDGICEALDETVTIAVFRIVQEALNNAVRHAQATHITVTLRNAQGQLCIAVSDNGTGIDGDQTHDGQGLINMHTRARLIGADLSIDKTGPNAGTLISIQLSVPARESD